MDQLQRCYRSLSEFLKSPFLGRRSSLFSQTIVRPLSLPDPSIRLPTTQRFTVLVTWQKNAQLNTALRELNDWCLINRLTPHPSKSEAVLISSRNLPVNVPLIFIGNSTIKWVSKSRLLRMTVDEKLTWTPHMLELKKSFAKKLGLLKKSRFLPRVFVRISVLRSFCLQWPMVLYCGVFAATPTYFSPWKGFIVGLRDLFLICPKTWHLLMSYNGPSGRPSLFIINLLFLSVFMKLSTTGYLSR